MAEIHYITANSSKFFENIRDVTDFKIHKSKFVNINLLASMLEFASLVYEE